MKLRVSLGEATGQATAAGVVTGSGTAVEAEGSLGEATGQAVAAVVLLVLSDSDDADLDVVAKALLVASAAGTSGNDLYADSDRGGTDTPLDGELGLGDGETVISRIRRFSATELNLNDNDSPAALDIGTYFDAGGDGNDLTIYLRTVADGEVSFTVASQFTLGGGNYARFTLPADAQTLLDNVAIGDRFIFKAARPAAVTTVVTGIRDFDRRGRFPGRSYRASYRCCRYYKNRFRHGG